MERVKLTDFGLARAVDDASLTQSGVVAGTPQYMSPEQARGEPVDHRSDLFSLGSVLYFMCTGHSPFRASSTPAVLRRVSDERPGRFARSISTFPTGWRRSSTDFMRKTRPDASSRPRKSPTHWDVIFPICSAGCRSRCSRKCRLRPFTSDEDENR